MYNNLDISMKKPLLLASQSKARRMLLQEAQIPFTLLAQEANEKECDWSQNLNDVVLSIARHKMDNIIMPQGHEGQIEWVLTADTLCYSQDGVICGKPIDRQDAINMIQKARKGMQIATAFCLHKKQLKNGLWQTIKKKEQVVAGFCIFDVPDSYMQEYLQTTAIFAIAGAMCIEARGQLFLKEVSGSYSAILGLPMYELGKALEELGFFDQ